MGTTPIKALRYPESTDSLWQGFQQVHDLASDVENKLPLGFVDEKQAAAGDALAVIGTQYKATGSDVVIPAKTVQRRYRVTVTVKLNLASSATPALFAGRVWRDGATIGQIGQVYSTVAGGGGQQTTVSVATALVAANTAVTFAAAATRLAGGAATDSIAAAYIEVEDIGGA